MQREEKVKNNINVLEMKQNKKLKKELMRRKLKDTKAVTLVALVVTMIVVFDQ